MRLPALVLFAYDPFNEYWKQIQQFAWRYAARSDAGPVLFVEPELWVVAAIARPRRELLAPLNRPSWSRALRGGFERKGPKFAIHGPVHWIPFASRLPALGRLDRRLVRGALRNAARRLAIAEPLLWVNQPLGLELLEAFPEARGVVFNWTDDWEAFARGEEAKRVARERVDALLSRADLVVAVSEGLRARAAARNPRAFVVPNGTDFERFSRAADPATEVAPELRGLPRPILGFVGYLTPRLDLPLLAGLARRRPAWTFAFVGPRLLEGEEAAAFFSLPNVLAIGPRAQERLPQYLRGMDVCLLPYRRDALSETADAIKVYDYLAAGRPVVASGTAGASRFEGIVRIADGVDAVERAVEASLVEDSPGARASRQEAARPHSWDARVEAIAELLRSHGFVEEARAGAKTSSASRP